MQQALPWILALAVLVVVAAGMAFWVTRPRQESSMPLPTEWALGPRPVFSVDERRAYRHLRESLPQHLILAKLPLVRFCQPIDPNEVRYWYELLGATHISFAVCSANGRVLVAIDLEGERPGSRRSQQIKQNVLQACRIRYLRCSIEHLPPAQELQMLVPATGSGAAAAPAPAAAVATRPVVPSAPRAAAVAAAGPAAAPVAAATTAMGEEPLPAASAAPAAPAAANPAPSPTAETAPRGVAAADAPASAAVPPVAPPNRSSVTAAAARPASAPQIIGDVKSADAGKRRKDRKALWQDSGLFQDSFFGIDNLRDAAPSNFAGSLLNERDRDRLSTFGPSATEDRQTLESQRPRRDPPR